MIAELGQYDIEFTGIEAAIQNWVREALELRHGAGEDPEGPLGNIDYSRGGNAISALLVRVRSRSDRVDMLLANVTCQGAHATRSTGRGVRGLSGLRHRHKDQRGEQEGGVLNSSRAPR